MKICYIASARSYYHPQWFAYFIGKGHQVHLISPDTSRVEMPGVHIDCFPQFRLKVLRLAFTLFLGGIYSRRIIDREKPDIVHAIELDEGFAAAASGFHPFVMTPNGSDLLVWAKSHPLVRIVARYVFARADAVTSDSLPLQKASLALGATRDRNYIIQWGVDLTRFHPRIDRDRVRAKYALGNSPLILSSRALTRNYNTDTIIRSLPAVLQEMPSAKMMFVYGFSGQEAEMKKLASALGVADATIFVGPVDYAEMPYYQAAADICLSVPSSDSSPRSVYEAMACGVPPILSDLPWTKDLIMPEQNALIVPARDYQALAKAILRLLADGELRQGITKANLKLVDEKLNYHKHMAAMETIYQSLLGK
ncbi:MAG: glycosyltransferase family 4 protein [Chloroflexi bacterium]|nr:glycosyltransferase family 4 protein [Chloroflexota bacterium]